MNKEPARAQGNPENPGRLLPLLAAILAMLGVSVFLYPQAAQWINQYRQSRIVEAYSQILDKVEPAEDVQVQEAHRYNKLLESGGLVDIAGHVPTFRDAAHGLISTEKAGLRPYNQQLNADGAGLIGRIKVPVADVDIPIYHGTSDSTLLQGAGHLQGTALPVGGAGTRTVITAHRGLAQATMFTYLDRVKKGDEITLEVFGQVLVYRVFDIQVVQPEDSETIKAVPGKDLATLITCTPLGINSQRIVITGERELPTPATALKNAGSASDLPHFPWWIVIWLVALGGSIGFYWFVRRPKDDAGNSDPAGTRGESVRRADALPGLQNPPQERVAK
ncbi:MAG: class C sortase [Arcanobacterium sp.]|nr:class C sortase [Arcanobacterium sp.]